MKKYQKYICVFAVIALLFCCFCIPASAATTDIDPFTLIGNNFSDDNPILTTRFMSEYLFPEGKDVLASNVSILSDGTGLTTWYATYRYDIGGVNPGKTSGRLTIDLPNDIVLKSGDTFALNVGVVFHAGNHVFKDYGISVLDTNGNVIGSDIRDSITMTDGSYRYKGVMSVETTIKEDCVAKSIVFQFNRTRVFWENNGWGFGVFSSLNIVHGDPDDIVIQSQLDDLNKKQEQTNKLLQENNAKIDALITEQEKTNEMLGEITADKYPAPDGSSVENVGEVEEQIQASTEEGFNVLTDTFKAFSLDTFSDGLGGIATIYNHIIPQTPWLFSLINISLGLGLFAFLLGLAQAYIGRLNANDRQARTEQYRQARLKQGRKGK